jgi:precorrin-3B C17-methyltransferase
MRSISDSGSQKRRTDRSQTIDSERHRGCGQNTLYIVGIGPGSADHLSQRALDVLDSVDTVVGYTTYIELIQPLIKDKRIVSTGMTKEIERVQKAIDIALAGNSCAIVSSGDPGIYAMAGLVFEMCRKLNLFINPPYSSILSGRSLTAKTDLSGRSLTAKADEPEDEKTSLHIEVVPGIPALCAGASLLGAPLAHDFAAISLSDLLTSWETIERRIEAAAGADFVIVLYNPKSKRRTDHIIKAQKIILKYRDKMTPVGIVTGAMRKNQDVKIIPLKELHFAAVNMQTTIFIGSSVSVKYLDYMITPRGYDEKYNFDESTS